VHAIVDVTAGIDIGSNTAKAALMEDGRLLGTWVMPAGYNAEAAGRRVLDELASSLGLRAEDIKRVIATGYGRKSVTIAHRTATELACHAAGARFLDPSILSVIDIGGQDSKAIVMDEQGRMINFTMNDKCAAGTGRFLEVMARAMEADIHEFGTLSLAAKTPAKISSICTVFAESEVISLIARGETRENIIAGIHEAIAFRVAAMANRLGIREPLMMTGGVSQNVGVVHALEKATGCRIIVSDHAQLAGAIGAALMS
jgi:predicted CoA-substrate-specific enzyme activase